MKRMNKERLNNMPEYFSERIGRGFKMIAIRPLEPTAQECNQTIKTTIVQSMQKSMSGKEDWHYFCNGCIIDEKQGTVGIHYHSLDDQLFFKGQKMDVHIGAIVGKNGSGKSTLVDLAIRMMNNVAASVFGEYPHFAAAEHLHFIDYVFGELIYLMDGTVYRLEIRNRQIQLHRYTEASSEGDYCIFLKKERPIIILNGGEGDVIQPLGPSGTAEILKNHFFYTVVCNYSFYAYNYRDYVYEQTNDERIKKITNNVGVEKEEEKYWVSGVFHKNDGYQTPIVLNPWRKEGNLDVDKENGLAMERIISLLFYDDYVSQQYPFRKILDKLTIKYIKLPRRSKIPVGKNSIVNKLFGDDDKYDQLRINIDEWLYQLIIDTWREFFYIGEIGYSPIEEDAKNYIVYKTLKICSHYISYTDIINEMMKANASCDTIKDRLKVLGADRTHITSKLRRACYQLRYKYYQYQDVKAVGLSVTDIQEWMDDKIHNHDDEKENCTLRYDDLLPPPFFDFNLGIEDDKGQVVPFTGLSTGERQATYVISNMMYHLVNINSAWNDRGSSHDVKYHYVNMMLDEVELYFHPDLQRRFIDMVLSAIRSVELPEIYGLNITLVTHSPFVISDLPDTNIMYLGRDYVRRRTFGANIYDLLDNTFFMDESIGELAKKRIEQFVMNYNKQLREWKKDDMLGIERRVDEEACLEFGQSLYFYRYLGEIIGDNYLRRELNDMIGELYKFYHEKGLME